LLCAAQQMSESQILVADCGRHTPTLFIYNIL
jgi:hypothetical protein